MTVAVVAGTVDADIAAAAQSDRNFVDVFAAVDKDYGIAVPSQVDCNCIAVDIGNFAAVGNCKALLAASRTLELIAFKD